MKPKFQHQLAFRAIQWLVIWTFLLIAFATARAASYNVTNSAGWSLIANQLDKTNGNTIQNVMPVVPDQTSVYKWNRAAGNFDQANYDVLVGWDNPTMLVNPGDGLYLLNRSAASFTLTFSGNPHVPVLPVTLGPNLVLLARQTNDIGTFTNIVGTPPPNFSVVYRFNVSGDPTVFAPPNYTVFSFTTNGGWSPSSPIIRVGESVWLTTNGSRPVITTQPSSQTVCSNSSATFTVVATGTLPLSYQWRLNGTALQGGTNASFVVSSAQPGNIGNYSVLVSNVFGTNLSANAALNLFTNTSAFGPTNQTACPGNTVTLTTFPSGSGPFSFRWTKNGNIISGATNASYVIASATAADAGTYCVTVTGTCGSVTNCATLTLSDTTPPQITCPPNIVTNTSPGLCVRTNVTFTPTVTDNCPGVTFTCTPASGSTFNKGVTTVVCTATDVGGRTAQCSFTVTIQDRQGPILSCPTNVVATCKGPQGTTVDFSVGISDNCDANLTATCNPPSGSSFSLGSTAVICTGRDSSGNSNSCSFAVIVQAGAPVIVCSSNITAFATRPEGAFVSFVTTASGCYSNITVACQPQSGSLFPVGVTTVQCTATDPVPNQSSCEFDVTVSPPTCCDAKAWAAFDSTLSGRSGHAMAYDSFRGRVVLFGGTAASLFGDTWEWNGGVWLFRASNGPSPRQLTAMCYDSARHRVVLFGGLASGALAVTPNAETWEWDGANWVPRTLTGPSPRYAHAMAYDSARGRCVLFGGVSTNGTELGDTWEYDGTKWVSAPTGIPGPTPRQGTALAYGSAQGQMLLFGGMRQGVPSGETWKWDGNAWTLLATSGPPARGFHAMAYNDTCDSIVLFGGAVSVNAPFADTWEWAGTSWTGKGTNGPGPRSQHGMAHDSSHNQTVFFGGSPRSQSFPIDTWGYSPNNVQPQVISVYATCGGQKITIAVNVPVSAATAQAFGNYHFSCNGVPIPLIQVVQTDDPRIICLFTSQPITGGATGASCSLFISGLQDICGRSIFYQGTVACAPEPCPGGRSSFGLEYWLTFPGNHAPDPANPPQPQLFITGPAGTIGGVAIPGLGLPTIPFTIPAAGEATVLLPSVADLGKANDLIQTNAVHVIASQPVSVYGMNHVPYSSDAFLGLPVNSLGKAYLVLAYSNLFANIASLSGSQFAIAATVDGTKVTIVPSANVGLHPANVPFNVLLMKGQTYQLRLTNGTPGDLSGTIVAADQPIAVFGSHRCANIPNTNTFFCDHLVEQLWPADMYGTTFVSVPFANRFKGDTYRFLALFDNTTVSTNGVALPVLNQRTFHEVQMTNPVVITSDRPILVAQYANSSDFDFVTISDPLMALIPPTTMYGTQYTVHSPITDFPNNFINIMGPATIVGHVLRNGGAVPAASFFPIGASGYWGAQVPVTAADNTLISDNNASFAAVVYGWAEYDAYGYPAGFCARPEQHPGFTCPPTNIVLTAGSGCVALVPDLTKQVGNGSSAVSIIQDPPPGTPLPPGVYIITVTIYDQSGQQTICRTTLTILPSSGPGLRCPTNIVATCTSAAGVPVPYQVAVCNTNTTVTCQPQPGTVFKPGITTVNCVASDTTGKTDTCSFTVAVRCPHLNISLAGTTLTIAWQDGAVLQKATNATGPWVNISNAPNPYQISISGRQAFFRLNNN